MYLEQFYQNFFNNFNSKSITISKIYSNLYINYIQNLINSDQHQFFEEINCLHLIEQNNISKDTTDSTKDIIDKHIGFLENLLITEDNNNIIKIRIILIYLYINLYKFQKNNQFIEKAINHFYESVDKIDNTNKNLNENDDEVVFNKGNDKKENLQEICIFANGNELGKDKCNGGGILVNEETACKIKKEIEELPQVTSDFYLILQDFNINLLKESFSIKSSERKKLLDIYLDYYSNNNNFLDLIYIIKNIDKDNFCKEYYSENITKKFLSYLEYKLILSSQARNNNSKELFNLLISFAKEFNTPDNNLETKTYETIKKILTNFDKPISQSDTFNKLIEKNPQALGYEKNQLNYLYANNIDLLLSLKLPKTILTKEEKDELLDKKKKLAIQDNLYLTNAIKIYEDGIEKLSPEEKLQMLNKKKKRIPSTITPISDNPIYTYLNNFLSLPSLQQIDFNKLADYPKDNDLNKIFNRFFTSCTLSSNNSLKPIYNEKVADYRYNVLYYNDCYNDYYNNHYNKDFQTDSGLFVPLKPLSSSELSDYKELISNNSIIPHIYQQYCSDKDTDLIIYKIELWSKVLFYGLNEDIDTAIHLLCPNLEDLIRKIIGKNTSVHNKKADEKTLSTLLDKEEYILKDKLGEELLFELNYLFCKEDEGGFNLRHNVAHGLKYDMEVCYYAWWRIMKFIFIDGISLINESSKNCEK